MKINIHFRPNCTGKADNQIGGPAGRNFIELHCSTLNSPNQYVRFSSDSPVSVVSLVG
jgi:hypothetical protein